MAIVWGPVLLVFVFFIVKTMGQKEVAQIRCDATDEVEFQPSTLASPIVVLFMMCKMLLLLEVLNFLVVSSTGWREGSESKVNYGEVAVLPPRLPSNQSSDLAAAPTTKRLSSQPVCSGLFFIQGGI